MTKTEKPHSERGSLFTPRSRFKHPSPILYYGAYTCFLLAAVCPALCYAYAVYRTWWAFGELLVFLCKAAWRTRTGFTISFLGLLCKGSPLAAITTLLLDENLRNAALPVIGWYIVVFIILSFYLGIFVVAIFGLYVLKGTDRRNGEHPYLIRKLIPHLPWLWEVFTLTLLTLLPPWGVFTLEDFYGDNEKRWHNTSTHPAWAAGSGRSFANHDDISVYRKQRKPVFSPTPKVNTWFRQRQ
ncbi:hypothetical protein F5Y13DRAFT_203968 [Hypoxylon sp. FL1857]|nr:hypothetical protein F5Y13DRAFT_203968 [Hypoxylon sp. FL1857]